MSEKKDVFGFVDEADNMEGFGDVNSTTIAVPFLQVLQKGSPQVNEKKPEYMSEAKVGDIINTVTKENYGSSINLIILKFEHMYTEWKPNRGGFVSAHDIGNAERIAIDKTFGKWKTAEGNDLSENYTYCVLNADNIDEGLMVMTLASTNIKKAKELNRMMTSHIMDDGQRAKPYYLIYNFHTEYKTKDEYDWYGLNFKFKEYINESHYNIIKPERKALPSRTIDYAQIEDTSNKSEVSQGKAEVEGDANYPY